MARLSGASVGAAARIGNADAASADSLPASGGWTGLKGYYGFAATFPKPYPTEPANKFFNVCESITDHLVRAPNNDGFIPGGFRARGLAYNEHLGRFIVVGTATGFPGSAMYSLSPDLINWSACSSLRRERAEAAVRQPP